MKTSVDTYIEPLEDFVVCLQKARILTKGTKGMRKAGQLYLPKNEAEEQRDYDARLKRSVLFNGFKKTLDDYCGRVFKQPVMFSEKIPEQIKEMDKKYIF